MSSTSANTKLVEYFARLPHLKADGSNFVTYRDRMVFAAEAAQLDEYLGENFAAPAVPVPADPQNPTTEEKESIVKHPEVVRMWNSNAAILKQGIAATVPDALFLKVKGEKTPGLMWKKVKDEYKKKSKMMTVDLRRKLHDMKCAENGDVKAHSNVIRTILEDLQSMGAYPGDNNALAIYMGSLPPSYDPYLSALTATSTLLTKDLNFETVMCGVNNEADCRTLKAPKKEEKEAAFNTSSGSSGRGRRFQGGKKSSNVECYNCHKKGHIKAECWAKGGGKEGQGPRGKGKGRVSGNKATNDDDGMWYAHVEGSESGDSDADWRNLTEENLGGYVEPWTEYVCNSEEELEGLAGLYLNNEVATPTEVQEDVPIEASEEAVPLLALPIPHFPDNISIDESCADSMPSLFDVSDSELDDDRMPNLQNVSDSSDCSDEGEYNIPGEEDFEIFSDFDAGKEIPDLEDWSDVEFNLEEVRDEGDNVFTRTFNTAFLAAAATLPNDPEVDLYDSGASRHMTPYRHCLFNYTPITPKSITAADKGKFEAIGKGDMHVYLPGKGGERA